MTLTLFSPRTVYSRRFASINLPSKDVVRRGIITTPTLLGVVR